LIHPPNASGPGHELIHAECECPRVCCRVVASLRGVAIQRGQRARTGSAVQTFASATADTARHPALTAAGLHGFPATASALPPGAALRAVYQDQFLQFAGNAAAVAAAEQAAVQRQAAAVQQAVQSASPSSAPYGSLPPSYAATAAYTAAAARYYTAAAAAASHQVNPAAAAAAAATAAGLTVPAYPFPVAHTVTSGVPRDYLTEPYLGHALSPVTGYGAAVYRNAYNRFAPY
jgi:RNA binding protein fox-1